MDRRLSRRPLTDRFSRRLAVTAGAAVLGLLGLSACGFNYATDRSNTITAGVTDQSGDIDVLNALIVSGGDGEGTFIATLANNETDPNATFHMTSLSFGSNSTISVAAFDPIEIKPHQAVNLADGHGIKVAGSFKAGDFLHLTVSFDNGQTSTLDVPVVTAAYQYEGLDNGTGSPSPSPSETSSDSASPTASAS